MAEEPDSPRIGRRTHPRARLDLPAEFVTLDGRNRCRMVSLSVCGARLKTDLAIRKGTTGFLRFGRTETFGTVVWTTQREAGIEFDELLDRQVVTAMRHLSESTRSDQAFLDAKAVRDWVNGHGRMPTG